MFDTCRKCSSEDAKTSFPQFFGGVAASVFILFILLVSCIRDELLNTECDIEAVSVHVDSPETLFYHDYDTMQTVSSVADSVVFLVRYGASVDSVLLTLMISPRACAYLIEQGQEKPFHNGEKVDFSAEKSQSFVIVSEDGAWRRKYIVRFVQDVPSTLGHMFMHFDFEQYGLDANSRYYVWSETDTNAVAHLFAGDVTWKNGNPGFRLSRSSALPMEYPSTPVECGGPDGSDCVKLETKDTGPFGRMVNMRLASGSMFIGEFDVANALKDALAATLFGMPFKHKPIKVSAWLKFECGPTYQDRNAVPVEGEVDQPDVYAVMFRNQDVLGNEVRLNGADVLTNPHIVGQARLPHPAHGLTAEWQFVELDMEYSEELDSTLLENNGYSFTVSFASSWHGGEFEGAIGNTLYVDGVTVECEY